MTTFIYSNIFVEVRGGKIINTNSDYLVVGQKIKAQELYDRGFYKMKKPAQYDGFGRKIRG